MKSLLIICLTLLSISTSGQSFPEFSKESYRSYQRGLNVLSDSTDLSTEKTYDLILEYLGKNKIAIDASNRPYVIRTSLIKYAQGSGWIEFTLSHSDSITLVEARAWGSNNAIVNILLTGHAQFGDIRLSTGGHPESPNGYILRVAASAIANVCGDVNFYKEKLTSW